MAKRTLDRGILIRATKADRDAWHKAAKRAGFEHLSEWIRVLVKKEIVSVDRHG